MRYITIFLATTIATSIAYFLFALTLSPAPIVAEYWVREMIVIKRNIVRHYTGQKKLIIASGSSSLFGIDANQLSDELKIPVINFGLHAGLSLETILSEAGAASEKGDIVILPLEPPYYCIKEPTNWQVRNIIAWDHEQWEKWSVVQRIKAVRMFDASLILELSKAKLEEKFRPHAINDRLMALDDQAVLNKFASAPEPTTFAYSAYNLDSLGDMKQTDGAKYFSVPRPTDKEPNICADSYKLLSLFATNMVSKGVQIYFANIPYVAPNKLDKEKIEATSIMFTSRLSQIAPVLDSKLQLVFPRKLFFDTDLHLNAEGRTLRTKLLADSIRNNEHLLAYIQ